MTSNFKILFSIDILNEYYENLLCQDFEIIPSTGTALLLKNYKILYKLVGNKLVLLIKIKDDDEPFINIDPNQKLVFYLSLNNPVFINISNVDLDEIKSKRFYFSNLSNNIFDSVLYLSSEVEDYDVNKTYKAGSFVNDGASVFESIRELNTGNPTSDVSSWKSKNKFQYATAEDMIKLLPDILNYDSSNANTNFTINVFALDTGTNDFTKLVKSEVRTFSTATKNIQVDLRELPKGKYKFKINSDEFFAYIDNDPVYENLFGVIEIFTHLPGINEFALFDTNNKVKEFSYIIRFANRLAFWKYSTPKHGVLSIIDNSNTYNFVQSPASPAVPDYFQSNVPIPMFEKPNIFNLELTNAISNNPPAAPNPDPQISGMLTRNDSGFFCNIYLNY